MKLIERKGEAAFDAFIDIMSPVFEVSEDEELRELCDKNVPMLQWLVEAIKRHREAFAKVFSVLNGRNPDEELTFSEILSGANELFADPLLVSLFLPRSQNATSSGSATASTKGKKK